jgi:hypothetical protein
MAAEVRASGQQQRFAECGAAPLRARWRLQRRPLGAPGDPIVPEVEDGRSARENILFDLGGRRSFARAAEVTIFQVTIFRSDDTKIH